MRSLNIAALFLMSFCVAGPAIVLGAFSPGPQGETEAELTPEQIIQEFTEKETEYFEAWMQYTYTQTAKIRILSVDNVPVKESMLRVSQVVFNDDGTREIRVIEKRGRIGLESGLKFTEEDEDIIDNLNPFALTRKERPLYNLRYRGQERVDELDCYVFSVEPKSTEGDRLYFEGKIWVDDVYLQVVRTVGKAVPELGDNRFPVFETIRQFVDGKYWFPAWSHADEVLQFPGQSVRIEETVTYEGYKKFQSKSTIRYGNPASSDGEIE